VDHHDREAHMVVGQCLEDPAQQRPDVRLLVVGRQDDDDAGALWLEAGHRSCTAVRSRNQRRAMYSMSYSSNGSFRKSTMLCVWTLAVISFRAGRAPLESQSRAFPPGPFPNSAGR